jgi:hypothetical protein
METAAVVHYRQQFYCGVRTVAPGQFSRYRNATCSWPIDDDRRRELLRLSLRSCAVHNGGIEAMSAKKPVGFRHGEFLARIQNRTTAVNALYAYYFLPMK